MKEIKLGDLSNDYTSAFDPDTDPDTDNYYADNYETVEIEDCYRTFRFL
ncbi:MAG: hypothetical protein JW915_04065 [Chitinispirillaceae bacterium]|nr:hypothetical protein [Chitinispirillaceae bacterium]